MRFITIYGIKRTLIKVLGRSRYPISLPNKQKDRSISVIGCGQFAFSTICYMLYFNRRGSFLGTYDIDIQNANSLSRLYQFKKTYSSADELIDDPNCKLIYIASNHSSHTPYALSAITRNIEVFIEKPIATNMNQFQELVKAIESSNQNIYVGYNRPFSPAMMHLKPTIENLGTPLTLSCYVTGHFLEPEHWYRKPEEGTRICGNMGHWIDLMIYLLNIVNAIPPDQFEISITYSNKEVLDDNLGVSFTTENNDLISILMSSRSEPFEGINETINLQCGKVIAKIDDFRKMTVWNGHKKSTKRYWPKDVGHKLSVLQPFLPEKRIFEEIKISTLIMLQVMDMVKDSITKKKISVNEEMTRIMQS